MIPLLFVEVFLWRRLPKGHVWVAASALQPSFEFWITPAGERVEQRSVLALYHEMASGSELREHSVGFAHGERCLHRGLGGGDAAAVVPNGQQGARAPCWPASGGRGAAAGTR